VVEDEALVRFDLMQTLAEAGFKMFEARDASEGIQVLEAHSEIRVVFTDIQMPGNMDGLALSHYVRGRWPLTIIIVCSGRRRPADEDMPSGAVFLKKPYRSQMLRAVLHEIHQEVG
jgi:two-component system, response regulator PdtaR